MKTINIVLVDDHELLLKGMASVLSTQADFNVTGIFTNGDKFLDTLENNPDPDILILDVNLNENEPEVLLQHIRKIRPELPILYLTILRGSRMFHRLEKFGIQGYLLKDIAYEPLFEAIRVISKGGTYFSDDITLNFEKDQSIKEKGFLNQHKNMLSPREQEILQLICKEYSSADIAEKLYISTKTVDTHRQNLMIKLGVSNSVGLVKYAIKNNLVEI
ncbi:MAG: response regulator transcription factor [Bacteroidetes bacterium]|nr:response regulator transcription factor [Bacteroidota bacterium]